MIAWEKTIAVNKSSIWSHIDWVSSVWAECSPSSSFSIATPLFSWRSYTVLCVSPLNIQVCRFSCCFFFFKRTCFFQFCFFPHQFWTSQTVLDNFFFLSDQNILMLLWQVRHVTSISFLEDFSWRHCVTVISCMRRPRKLSLLSWQLGYCLLWVSALLQHCSCSHRRAGLCQT